MVGWVGSPCVMKHLLDECYLCLLAPVSFILEFFSWDGCMRCIAPPRFVSQNSSHYQQTAYHVWLRVYPKSGTSSQSFNTRTTQCSKFHKCELVNGSWEFLTNLSHCAIDNWETLHSKWVAPFSGFLCDFFSRVEKRLPRKNSFTFGFKLSQSRGQTCQQLNMEKTRKKECLGTPNWFQNMYKYSLSPFWNGRLSKAFPNHSRNAQNESGDAL